MIKMLNQSLLSKLKNNETMELNNLFYKLCSSNERKELYELFLEILKEGNSYPQNLPYSFSDFLGYFFSKNSQVIICKSDLDKIIGGFYIKPNFEGKSSHIANCGYIVRKEFRRQKIGFQLGRYSIDIAKELGYRGIIFNLIFKENIASVKLWGKLGFKIIGTIPEAVKINDTKLIDAHIMYLNLF